MLFQRADLLEEESTQGEANADAHSTSQACHPPSPPSPPSPTATSFQ